MLKYLLQEHVKSDPTSSPVQLVVLQLTCYADKQASKPAQSILFVRAVQVSSSISVATRPG
jgi:hypothetical protein